MNGNIQSASAEVINSSVPGCSLKKQPGCNNTKAVPCAAHLSFKTSITAEHGYGGYSGMTMSCTSAWEPPRPSSPHFSIQDLKHRILAASLAKEGENLGFTETADDGERKRRDCG